MLNVVVLMGRLVADPQLRQTTTGKNVASFRVACDRGRRDANGQNQADFFDVVAWDRSAEFVCRYFQKGSMIAIDGRAVTIRIRTATTALRSRSWPVTLILLLPNPRIPLLVWARRWHPLRFLQHRLIIPVPQRSPLLPPIRLAATMTLH